MFPQIKKVYGKDGNIVMSERGVGQRVHQCYHSINYNLLKILFGLNYQKKRRKKKGKGKGREKGGKGRSRRGEEGRGETSTGYNIQRKENEVVT